MMGRRRCPCKKGMSLVAVSSLSVGEARYAYVRIIDTVSMYQHQRSVVAWLQARQELLDLQV